MPTVLTHALLPVIAALAVGKRQVPSLLTLAGAIAAVLPDADVAGFAFGIPYGAEFGHRGASHSLAFGPILGLGAALAASQLKVSRRLAFGFVATAAVSHGLTDALTNGGRGVALFWPLDSSRHFAPITPIEVSPIGVRFCSNDGYSVLLSEAVWLILPSLFAAFLVRYALLRRALD